MSYRSWECSTGHMAMYADWFEIYQLMDALQKVRKQYAHGSSEALAGAYKLIFVDTPQSAPYNEHTRFPEDKRYICDVLADWKSRFNRLRVMCLRGMQKPDDLETSEKFLNLINEMMDELLRGDYFLDRVEFEVWGCSRWLEDDEELTFWKWFLPY